MKEERESGRRAKRKLIGGQSPAISNYINNYNFRVNGELSGDSLFSKK